MPDGPKKSRISSSANPPTRAMSEVHGLNNRLDHVVCATMGGGCAGKAALSPLFQHNLSPNDCCGPSGSWLRNAHHAVMPPLDMSCKATTIGRFSYFSLEEP